MVGRIGGWCKPGLCKGWFALVFSSPSQFPLDFGTVIGNCKICERGFFRFFLRWLKVGAQQAAAAKKKPALTITIVIASRSPSPSSSPLPSYHHFHHHFDCRHYHHHDHPHHYQMIIVKNTVAVTILVLKIANLNARCTYV